MKILKPCFCGGEAEIEKKTHSLQMSGNHRYVYRVSCKSCNKSMGILPNTEERAVAEWNKRFEVDAL